MATGTRIRKDFIDRTLATALAAIDTTIDFGTAPNLPTLAAGEYVPIVLDPDGTPEIVHLTAYTATDTTGTIERGQEGTTAAAHLVSVDWRHGPTVADFGGGDLEVIERVVLTAAQASFDFQNIPQTYEDLRLVVNGRSAGATEANSLWMKVNNDSTAGNYGYRFHIAMTGWHNNDGVTSSADGAFLGNMPGANAAAGAASFVVADIAGYARTAFHKAIKAQAGNEYQGGGQVFDAMSVWKSTAAITRLTITPESGNLVAGSVATLYGLK